MAWAPTTNFNSRSANAFGLVGETFVIFFSRLPQIFHASLVPAALLVLIFFAATPFRPTVVEGEMVFPEDSGSILFLFLLMDFMILQAFAVAIIRAIFTGSTPGVLGIAFSKRELRYAFLSIILALILLLFVLVLMIAFFIYAAIWSSAENLDLSESVLIVVQLLAAALIGYSYLSIRLAPSLIAAALDHPGNFFEIIGDSWENTRGTVLGAFGAMMMLSTLQGLTFWLFWIPISFAVYVSESMLLGYLLGTLYGMGFVAFFLSMVAAYHNRVGGWVSYDP